MPIVPRLVESSLGNRPGTLGALVRAERSRAERLLNWIRISLVGLLALGAIFYAPALPPSVRDANFAVLLPMLLWAVAQEVVSRMNGGLYPEVLSVVSPLVDATGVTAILVCYGVLASPVVALKAPVTLVYFAILAARPMTGSARGAAIAAVVIVVEYCGAVAYLMHATALVTVMDPITAASTGAVSILDEASKLGLLAVAGAISAYATSWHERVLKRALSAQVERADDERALNARLQEADKLAALGTLAASIAHEVNNPLTAIALSADMLGASLQDLEVRKEVAAIASDARHTASVVRDLLVFSRGGESTHQPVSLSAVAARALEPLRHMLRDRDVTVERDFADDLPHVQGDARGLERVVVNLVINAIQAMKGSRQRMIRVATRYDDHTATLVVEDSGPGFAPEIAGRLFDRFFTTKPAGEGTGLGLWMAAQMIQSHGGSIVATNSGRGARFTITIPREAEAAAA